LTIGLACAVWGCKTAPQSQRGLDAAAGAYGERADGAVEDGDSAGAPADVGPTFEVPARSTEPVPSAGCNAPAVPQALGQYVKYSVHVTGETLDPAYTAPSHDRAYAVWLPPDYEPAVPHRTVYVAGACGSTAGSDSRYTAPDGDRSAIYVGLDTPPAIIDPMLCLDNTGSRSTEWEFFALVAAQVERTFCVDRNDEVVAGVRGGGTLANMLGCYFAAAQPGRRFAPDLALRAQFSVASGLPKDLPACSGPIAGLWMHDMNELNPPTDSLTSLARVLAADGCAESPTASWGTGPLAGIGCQKYTACPASDPVMLCETTGRGRQANYYSITVPALVQFLGELDSAR
jgi:hypothetical protein